MTTYKQPYKSTYFFYLHKGFEEDIWGTLVILGTGLQEYSFHCVGQLSALLLKRNDRLD